MNSTPTSAQKVAAEVLGTFVLTFFGVGAAVMTGAFNEAAHPSHYIVTGLAFGLTVLVMASAVGRVSGGHFNPAVTLGAAVAGRLELKQIPLYWISQLVGAALAGAALWFILDASANYDIAEMGMGTNGYAENSAIGISLAGALFIEALLTAVFLWVILAVTDSRTEVSAVLAPAAIGMMLALIHFASMSATGTSVNPARSFGPALFVGGDAISQLWVFIVAPLVGAAIAGVTYALMFGKDPSFDETTPEEPFEDLNRAN